MDWLADRTWRSRRMWLAQQAWCSRSGRLADRAWCSPAVWLAHRYWCSLRGWLARPQWCSRRLRLVDDYSRPMMIDAIWPNRDHGHDLGLIVARWRGDRLRWR